MRNPTCPCVSVIIGVYNDWDSLEKCLKSLSQQQGAPSFEVVIVDDGSTRVVSDVLRSSDINHPLRFVRQAHGGISTARNTGMRNATGAVFFFTDCDCILDRNCLHELSDSITRHSDDNCFQLHLLGDSSHLVGKAEELHLAAIQSQTPLPDGHIRYLNTAGAAIRRSRTALNGRVFDPRALRGQDSLLLAELILSGEFPRFVPSAVVVHNVRLPLFQYIRKGFWTGYVEGKTYRIIRSLGVSIRTTGVERSWMLASMCRKCISQSWCICILLIVIARQTLTHAGGLFYRWFNPREDDDFVRSGLSRGES